MATGEISQPVHKVKIERGLAMRARDGVTLYADVYRPDAPGKFPVLVMRTPYDKSQQIGLTERDYFPQRGYVLVVQDTRGRFSSEGEFYPFVHEANDGYDAIEWAAALPWSSGAVGTVGQSYLGLVQYQAAPTRPPHLKVMCPVSGPVTYFENCIFRRGVFELGWDLTYFLFMSRNVLERKGIYEKERATLDAYLDKPELPFSPLTAAAYRHLPVRDWGERLRAGAPYLADFLANWRDGDYWAATDVRPRCTQVNVPMLHVGSWYDAFQYDTLAMYTHLKQNAATEQARHGQRLLMGPWAHLLPYAVPTSRGTGDIDFGPEAKIELHAIQLRWFDHFLKGAEPAMLDEPPVRIFVMGENRWRDEWEWPLKRTAYTKIYLRSGGHANTLSGDGALSLKPPADEPNDGYTYDPENPVPTLGGTTLGLTPGVFDQREIETRPDVLVYTGATLESDLEVTGPIAMRLFAASSAPDTDFIVKLVDVRPDGYAHNIAEGVIRARFRDSLSAPTLIKPGEIYAYDIDMWSTSHMFRRGHRIRVEITSSNFPRYDRNPNTGGELGLDTELKTAHQSVFHKADAASYLLLPVIPR